MMSVRFLIPVMGAILVMAGCSDMKNEVEAPASVEGRRTVIVHGYMARPDSHWFPWLAEQLEERGQSTAILELPSPDAPDAEAWKQTIMGRLSRADEQTFVVAHSLGTISTLRALNGLPDDTKIGGLVLVSGFSETLEPIPALDGFLEDGVDLERAALRFGDCVVITARDDEIVPPELSERLAEGLDCKIHVLEAGGHFLGSDGHTTLPLVLEEVLRLQSRD